MDPTPIFENTDGVYSHFFGLSCTSSPSTFDYAYRKCPENVIVLVNSICRENLFAWLQTNWQLIVYGKKALAVEILTANGSNFVKPRYN